MSRNFIIYADNFNEDLGGTIALHRLCDILNKVGEKAYLWPFGKAVFEWRLPLASATRIVGQWYRGHFNKFAVLPGFQTPIASHFNLARSIVIYPEVIDGNPLRAKRVVRWLLHKPGFHTARANFEPTDRFFFYQHAFNDPKLNPDGDNLLRTLFVRDDVYGRVNLGPRHGTCHVFRKGAGRRPVHDVTHSILVDGKSHTELAQIFNDVEMCISYDLYTMYSLFAALCGCISVVVPQEGMSIEQWYPDPADRYGVAYGFDDVPRALATQHLLLPRLKAQEDTANASVREFIRKCRQYFPA